MPVSRLLLVATVAGALHAPPALCRAHQPSLAHRVRPPPTITMNEPWGVFGVLTSSSAAAQWLGVHTKLGRLLSAPICAMLCTFVGSSSGLLPPAGNHVIGVQSMAVKLATPLLLFNADMRRVASGGSRLLPAFGLALLGSVSGAAVGVAALHAHLFAALGDDGLKAAAALMAKNIGGGFNFVAVAAAVGMSPAALAIALTVDNLFALIYFPFCSYLGGRDKTAASDAGSDGGDSSELPPPPAAQPGLSTTFEQSASLAVSCGVLWLASRVAPTGYDLPVATLLMVAAATAGSAVLRPLAPAAEQLGTLLLFLFFATAGWTGGALGLSTFVGGGLPLLGFLGLLYGVHLVVTLGGGGWLAARSRRSGRATRFFALRQLLLASNACIGGPATASALAVSSGWEKLLIPSVLVGNLGYAVATFLGIGFYRGCKAICG